MVEAAFGSVEQFEQDRESYQEAKRIKEDTDIIIGRYKELFEGEVYDQRPEILGVLAGIKPGLIIDQPIESNEVAMLISGMEDRYIQHERFIVNSEALLQRVEDEPDFAAYVGWDSEKTIKENISKAGHTIIDSPQANSLTGFILGFPESSVRGNERALELQQQGVPEAAEFLQIALYQELWDQYKIEEWDDEDQDVLVRMGEEYFDMWEQTESLPEDEKWNTRDKMTDELNDRFFEDIVRMGERYFNVSQEDMDQRANHRLVEVTNPAGERVMYFATYSRDEDPGIQILQQKVTAMFTGLGLTSDQIK